MSSKKSISALEKLLASYSVFYINLRGYHWNLMGDSFFEFHTQFEKMYSQTEETIDRLAERLRALGEFVVADYSTYAEQSFVSLSKIKKSSVSDAQALDETVESLQRLINFKKEVLPSLKEEKDYATEHMFIEDVLEEEKTLWMLKSYMGK